MLYGPGVYKLLQGWVFYRPESHETIAAQLQAHAANHPDRPFLRYETQRYSYSEANARINQHADAYRALGIRAGDVVALLLENRPEYLWHVFGLHKLGAISSLINSNLQGEALIHAIRICSPTRVVVGSEVWSKVEPVIPAIAPLTREHVDVDVEPGDATPPNVSTWAERLEGCSTANPSARGPMLREQAAFIYTSGTTGLPKAAIVRHDRFYRAGRVWGYAAFMFERGNVLYNCLPLYHSNALLLATSSVITAGVCMALARKFSRTHFWSDVRKHEATSFIYIGELLRYLLNSPPSSDDRAHSLRSISGNGLRPEIWREFQQRFGIDRIAEFYGATEGNTITLNVLNVFGSVGPRLPGMALVQWNDETQDFARDAHGKVVRVRGDQPGILLGKIRRRSEFEGYHDKAATEAKILRDVFRPGDAWFNTGDLLKLDGIGHLYFVDRVGDTFRWKGENVATSEVQAHILKWEAVEEASVYGVSIPGTEGRAGMAAIVMRGGRSFDPGAFRDHVERGLPAYARPLFVRVRAELEKTSTFKLQKVELQREGFDPARVPDTMYFLNSKSGRYELLTPEVYAAITSGELRM